MVTKCKRATVTAMGMDAEGNVAHATNGNTTHQGCTNVIGQCGCEHAEMRLLDTMPRPVIVVLSHSPCRDCALWLAHAKVKKVLYLKPYRISDGIDYLRQKGVIVEHIGGDSK